MTVIRPVYQQGYVVRDVNASLNGIAAACERLYLDMRANPDYIVLSQAGHDAVYREAEKTWTSMPAPGGSVVVMPKLVKLINQITGGLMEVFISDRIPDGTMLFGTFSIE